MVGRVLELTRGTRVDPELEGLGSRPWNPGARGHDAGIDGRLASRSGSGSPHCPDVPARCIRIQEFGMDPGPAEAGFLAGHMVAGVTSSAVGIRSEMPGWHEFALEDSRYRKSWDCCRSRPPVTWNPGFVAIRMPRHRVCRSAKDVDAQRSSDGSSGRTMASRTLMIMIVRIRKCARAADGHPGLPGPAGMHGGMSGRDVPYAGSGSRIPLSCHACSAKASRA